MDSVTCTTCGMLNKPEDNYCLECGCKIIKNTTLDSRPFELKDNSLKTYILERDKFILAGSTFTFKNNGIILFKLSSPSRLRFFLNGIISGTAIIPLFSLMMLIYAIFPIKEQYIFELSILLVFIISLLIALSFINENNKFKILSENNEPIGFIKSSSKFYQIKSLLLFKKWKFFSIEQEMGLSIHFKSNYEGILISSKNSFEIVVSHNKEEKQFERKISKIQANNAKDKSIISMDVPEKVTRRQVPKPLKIYANASINELLVVFFVIVLIRKFYTITH